MASFFMPSGGNPKNQRELPGFYNVGGVVGAPPALNDAEDVFLVQYLFNLLGRDPTDPNSATWKTVLVTGVIDSLTINAIVRFQQRRQKFLPGTIVDGRVSPAKGYAYGPSFYTIALMNEFVQRDFYEQWPRLDRMPACPVKVKDMVIRTLVGFRRGVPKSAVA